jgi:hypothetical protein
MATRWLLLHRSGCLGGTRSRRWGDLKWLQLVLENLPDDPPPLEAAATPSSGSAGPSLTQ